MYFENIIFGVKLNTQMIFPAKLSYKLICEIIFTVVVRFRLSMSSSETKVM